MSKKKGKGKSKLGKRSLKNEKETYGKKEERDESRSESNLSVPAGL